MQVEEKGFLVKHIIKNGENKLEIELPTQNKNHFIDFMRSTVLKVISRGKVTYDQNSNYFHVDQNYIIPSYWIIMQSYLILRSKFKEYFNENYEDINFYFSTLKPFDAQIVLMIKDFISDLAKKKFILLFYHEPQELNEAVRTTIRKVKR